MLINNNFTFLKNLFQTMEQTLLSLESQKNWKEFIKKSCRKNKISIQIAAFFTPIKFRILYDRLLKTYQSQPDLDETCWVENELRAFHWFLVIISGLKQLLIQNFDQKQWDSLRDIFLNKTESVLKYESIKLVNQKLTKNRNWNQQQTQLLTQIIKQNQNSNKWNDIARKLYQTSNDRYFRSGKQCRERWLNHLDPNKKRFFFTYFRGQWDQEEDRIIVKYIVNHGRRWSKIAKQLGNHRTQHMVKNRFKTLIIRQKKLTPKTSNENILLREMGYILFGQAGVPIDKKPVIKEQNQSSESQQNSLSLENHDEVKISEQAEKKLIRRTNILIPQLVEEKDGQKGDKKRGEVKKVYMGFEDYNGGRDRFMMEQCSKGMGAVSTPMSSYEMPQIYSPYYLSYQGVTPFLSPSSSVSVPFFMNTPMNATMNVPSFSAFDNNFNQNLFLCPGFTSGPAPGGNYPQ